MSYACIQWCISHVNICGIDDDMISHGRQPGQTGLGAVTAMTTGGGGSFGRVTWIAHNRHSCMGHERFLAVQPAFWHACHDMLYTGNEYSEALMPQQQLGVEASPVSGMLAHSGDRLI